MEITTSTISSGDRRPLYIWIIVLLANIGTVLYILSLAVNTVVTNSVNNFYQDFFKQVFDMESLYILGISIVLSVVPVIISKINNKWVVRLGYGVPILLLLSVPYFIYDFYTCTGKLCQLVPLLFGLACGLSSVVISTFYTLGRKVTKWSPKVFVSIMCIEIILLISSIIFWYINNQFKF